jgi:hypothetical protein
VEGGSEGEFDASGVVVSRRRRGAPVPRRRTGPCDAFCCSGPDPGFLARTIAETVSGSASNNCSDPYSPGTGLEAGLKRSGLVVRAGGGVHSPPSARTSAILDCLRLALGRRSYDSQNYAACEQWLAQDPQSLGLTVTRGVLSDDGLKQSSRRR